MKKLNRREFIKAVSLVLGTIAVDPALSACSQTTGKENPLEEKKEFHTLQPEAQSKLPYLVVARNGEPEQLVRKAISALGDIQRFVPKGAKVAIKPNMCVAYHTYEYAATTNPWVVGSIVKLCIEAGASQVQVMDFPFGGTADEAYSRSGIAEQVRIAGGLMIGMPSFRFKKTEIPDPLNLKEAKVFDEFLLADVIINIPIAKHHSLAKLTLGMKNLMGTVLERPRLHQDLGRNLADIAGLIRPTMTVIDAVRVLTNNGPTGGNLDDVKKLDTIIVSTDIVAADSYAATLFGKKPTDLGYIVAGVEKGLGRSDLHNLKIEEINLAA